MQLLSISIVIYQPNTNVLHKVFKHLLIAINTLHQHHQGEVSITIVDNSPVKKAGLELLNQVHQMFSKCATIHYLHCPENKGYGAANNKVMLSSKAQYHLVINPDAYVASNTLVTAIDYMNQNPDVGLCAPTIYNEAEERQYLCKKNPTLFDGFLRAFAPVFIKKLFAKRLHQFEYRNHDYNNILLNIPFLSGCFLFFRTELAQRIGGFDERFFMYYEDADITRRVLTEMKTAYVPQMSIIHLWQRANHKNFYMRGVAVKSAFKYWRKWGGVV